MENILRLQKDELLSIISWCDIDVIIIRLDELLKIRIIVM